MRKVVLALALVGTLGACSAEPVSQAAPAAITTWAPAPVGEERGSLVSQMTMGHTDFAVRYFGAEAVHVVYRSTSGAGDAGTEVSGVVFIPKGDPPEGGWPIVSVAHGTTGVTDECAPSLYPNLLGTIGTVAPFLERGMVVAVTDYEGIGTPGSHPYLDPDAAAHNVIDAVRAARNVVPSAGTRWAAIGNSQGGQAVWAAAERGDYGDGLDRVVAGAEPVADVRCGQFDDAPTDVVDSLSRGRSAVRAPRGHQVGVRPWRTGGRKTRAHCVHGSARCTKSRGGDALDSRRRGAGNRGRAGRDGGLVAVGIASTKVDHGAAAGDRRRTRPVDRSEMDTGCRRPGMLDG